MYQIDDVKGAINRVAQAIREHRDYLGELDGKSGDGDLGLSMENAFDAVQSTADEYAGSSIAELLTKAAMNCNRAAPSTMGTLMSAGILSVAKAAKGKDAFSDEDVVGLPRAFAEAIMARGKAKLGDKTILDALLPLADTLEAEFAKNRPLKEAFAAAAQTAKTAAEATAGMRAAIGRAKWLGERAAEYPDGGAILCAVIAETLAQ
ncbi:MAG: DAK2 domain-containing protein [Clostridiales bacterium]|nr:DAK2 domain-containing protein [Clostridiales bacterium]